MRNPAIAATKEPITWILVADGRRAQVYTRHSGERRIPLGGNARHRHYDEVLFQELVAVTGMAFNAEPLSLYDYGRNQLGRVFESANTAHHMAEPRIDVQEEIKRKLMKKIADRLNEAQRRKAFDRLVLVAPPKMLGVLRELLSPAVQKRVVAEMPKDLVQYDRSELIDHLGTIA